MGRCRPFINRTHIKNIIYWQGRQCDRNGQACSGPQEVSVAVLIPHASPTYDFPSAQRGRSPHIYAAISACRRNH